MILGYVCMILWSDYCCYSEWVIGLHRRHHFGCLPVVIAGLDYMLERKDKGNKILVSLGHACSLFALLFEHDA